MKIERSERDARKNDAEVKRRQEVALGRRRVVLGALAFWASGTGKRIAQIFANDGTQLADLKEVANRNAKKKKSAEPVDWFREDWNFDVESFSLPASALEAVDATLEALAARLNDDGSFGCASELFGRDPGVAGLCGLAFLGAGSLPGRGRFGRELEKITDYISSRSFDAKTNRETHDDVVNYLRKNELSAEEIDGLIVDFREKGGKSMYGHGFATLFLASILGATERSEVRERVRAAVELLVRTQNADGGWRYEPKRVPVADVSVTVCQLSALRAARDAGVFVPNATIENAVGYVKKCQNADGGFRYMTLDGPSGIARTAAAILALQAGAEDDSEAVARAFRYLEKAAPLAPALNVKRLDKTSYDVIDEIPRLPTSRIEYYFYGEFYAALAYWRSARDTASKERWARWARRAYPNLLARRGDDGLWRSNVSVDAETALVLCALLVPFERTPFFLR
ncbi:MAG: terpene cyclase/mutase family protein [Thermoguttaceae bacterium]|nr:terpene cyclase/mutase family protein [Thermoguttaceae bacterium]